MGFPDDVSDGTDAPAGHVGGQQLGLQFGTRVFPRFPGEDLRDFEPIFRPEFSVGKSGVVRQVLAVSGLAEIFEHVIRPGHNVDQSVPGLEILDCPPGGLGRSRPLRKLPLPQKLGYIGCHGKEGHIQQGHIDSLPASGLFPGE